MAKTQWPATVKMAWWEDAPSSPGRAKLPVEIGDGEVAVVLAIQPQIVNTSNDNDAAIWLYRRSEPPETMRDGWSDFGGNWQQDTNVLDYTRGFILGRTTMSAYKVYPYPLVLIRSPSVIWQVNTIGLVLSLGIWYVRQSITDKEMAELMVKDHA